MLTASSPKYTKEAYLKPIKRDGSSCSTNRPRYLSQQQVAVLKAAAVVAASGSSSSTSRLAIAAAAVSTAAVSPAEPVLVAAE